MASFDLITNIGKVFTKNSGNLNDKFEINEELVGYAQF